ncbi:hypothetical protein R1flu_007183 [Riccia fluitans]|uniref:Uncharacterized protein n=1 Tax=Riccia fluitans TaxID=41844 RepID=A0ABD1YY53_9MARC
MADTVCPLHSTLVPVTALALHSGSKDNAEGGCRGRLLPFSSHLKSQTRKQLVQNVNCLSSSSSLLRFSIRTSDLRLVLMSTTRSDRFGSIGQGSINARGYTFFLASREVSDCYTPGAGRMLGNALGSLRYIDGKCYVPSPERQSV